MPKPVANSLQSNVNGSDSKSRRLCAISARRFRFQSSTWFERREAHSRVGEERARNDDRVLGAVVRPSRRHLLDRRDADIPRPALRLDDGPNPVTLDYEVSPEVARTPYVSDTIARRRHHRIDVALERRSVHGVDRDVSTAGESSLASGAA